MSYNPATGISPGNDQLLSSISHPVGTYNYPLTQMIDYQTGAVAIYIGYAIPGSSINSPLWAIQYITYNLTGTSNGTVASVQWSPNYMTFGDVWTNRTNLTYA